MFDARRTVSATYRGYRSDMGPGIGEPTRNNDAGNGLIHGAGGGHGGEGSMSYCQGSAAIPVSMGGPAYGSAALPTTFGSGGRSGFCHNCIDQVGGRGGYGGGLVKVVTADSVKVIGTHSIQASGERGINVGSSYGGGGAGGSIQVHTARLIGWGTMRCRSVRCA